MKTYEGLQMETIVFDAEYVITTSIIPGSSGDIVLPSTGKGNG